MFYDKFKYKQVLKQVVPVGYTGATPILTLMYSTLSEAYKTLLPFVSHTGVLKRVCHVHSYTMFTT